MTNISYKTTFLLVSILCVGACSQNWKGKSSSMNSSCLYVDSTNTTCSDMHSHNDSFSQISSYESFESASSLSQQSLTENVYDNIYESVVIFGVDGAGGFFENVDTPFFDKIFGKGSVNYNGLSQNISYSAQNWASMLLGVKSEMHKMTNDSIASTKNSGSPYPTIFSLVSGNHPDATFFSAVYWSPINYGIIEDGINGMTKVDVYDSYSHNTDFQVDEKVADLAIERTENHRDSITFLHLACIDVIGHSYGSDSEECASAIKFVDSQIGRVFEAYQEKGLLDTTLFVFATDHGHTSTGGHGGNSSREMQTTLAISGSKNIIAGCSGNYVTDDLAPIVLYALGLEAPNYFTGKIPSNIFKDLS